MPKLTQPGGSNLRVVRKLPPSVSVTKFRERGPFRPREDATAPDYTPSKQEMRSATKVQLDYYNRLGLWKTKSELKRERMQVRAEGEHMN